MKKTIWRKLFGSFLKLVLPALILVVTATVAASVLLVHSAATPPRAAYLVTPERLTQFTASGGKITDESWKNKDATTARGWLARGKENAPAVIVLHRYGADRSWLLNLGSKLHEETGFTVLMPDLRGHGENPPVKWTSFGGGEAEDLASAVEFLRAQKTADGKQLVGEKIGVYGVEVGAIAALLGAGKEKTIQVLALDSVPASSEEALKSNVKSRTSVAVGFLSEIASKGTNLYYLNSFNHSSVCEAAQTLNNQRVLLLAGKDNPDLQASTANLAKCFASPSNVQSKTDMELSGFNLVNRANSKQDEAYSQIVIDYFRSSLSN